MINQTPLHEDV